MAIVLGHNIYGKSEVRVLKVVRSPERHELRDLTVDVALTGEFAAAHLTGDNGGLLATDTMRNTVYALAKDDPIEHLESFARRLVEHFVLAGPSVSSARVRIAEHPWERIGDHPHAFQRGSGGQRIAVVAGGGREFSIEAGIDDLLVLKTTDSGWSGFLREQYTTLPETDDRILATVITASWRYSPVDAFDYTAVWHRVRATMLEAFGDHYSPSVQFTLRRIGEAVLEACAEIERIHLSLPNRHQLLFDLGRFGLANDNEIFHATTEPYGLIEGTVERVPDT
ncbi:MAG: urate oxidase [Actinomycetota bacterium]|nr:urate oxidase [Actinomycetota bacterium]